MPNEYISRERAINEAYNVRFDDDNDRSDSSNRDNFFLGKEAAAEAISKIPAADVVEVVRGEWRRESYMDEYESPPKRVYVGYSCDRCGCSNAIKTRYCARCGAKMDGGEKHAD